MIKNRHTFYIWFLLGFTLLLFFYKSLHVFFVQDDFNLISISRASDFSQFLRFFIPLSDNVWYRPLSSQVFFFLATAVFGLNPVPFHLVVLLTHTATALFMYLLINLLLSNKTISLFSSVFYALNQLHVVSLSWLAAFSFIQGPLFILISLYAYYKKRYGLALLLYFLGLLTTEVLVIFPVILFIFEIVWGEAHKLRRIIPYVILGIGLLVLRLVVFPTQQTSELYKTEISLQVIGTFRFYLLRLFNLPLLISTLSQKEQWLVLSGSVLFMGAVLIGMYFLCQNKAQRSRLFFFLSLGLVGLSPFLLLPHHLAPHYLSFSLLGIAPVFGISLYEGTNRLGQHFKIPLLMGLVVLFILLQYVGSRLTYETHWIFKRAQLAHQLIRNGQITNPIGSEEYFALGGNSVRQNDWNFIYENKNK